MNQQKRSPGFVATQSAIRFCRTKFLSPNYCASAGSKIAYGVCINWKYILLILVPPT